MAALEDLRRRHDAVRQRRAQRSDHARAGGSLEERPAERRARRSVPPIAFATNAFRLRGEAFAARLPGR